MNFLMLAALLLAGQNAQQAPPNQQHAAPGQQMASSGIDGNWSVLFCEKDGQKVTTNRGETVTIKGNVLTWNKDGKEHRVHLNLGPNHMLTAVPEDAQQPAHVQAKPGEAKPGEAKPGEAKAGEAKSGEAKAAEINVGQTKPGEVVLRPAVPRATQVQSPHGPGTKLPIQVEGQIPGQPAGTVAQQNMPQGSRHGVYIESSEFLCLALDQSFGHEMNEPTAATQPKPGTHPGSTAANTNNAQPHRQTATNQPTEANRQNAEPGARPHAGTPATAAHPGQPAQEVRQAAYGPGGTEHQGFILILQRENAGNMQHR
jgi:hypothetical protein